MEIGSVASFITIGIAILIHTAASIWWASKITTTIESINTTIIRFDKDLEKRDTASAAMWKKIDNIKDRMIVIESKCKIHYNEDRQEEQ